MAKRKPPKLWLCREDAREGTARCWYHVGCGQAPDIKSANRETLERVSVGAFCPEDFHRLCPHLEMRPGDPPIAIRVERDDA